MFEDDTDEGNINVLIDFTQKVNLVRMAGNALMPTRLTIKAEVLPSEDAVELDFDIAFAKIKFWFETVVVRTIAFGRNNTQALAMFTDAEGRPAVINPLMITPNEPTDEHLGAVFQAKMAALSGGLMEFGAIRVNSESATGLVWSYVGDWREDLPTMDKWFSTKPYYFDKPWWERDDASTLDMLAAGVTDMTKIPTWAMPLDFIEAAIRPHHADAESDEDAADAPETLENIVIKGAFSPKVIDGESDE